jgi:hypothetical protein
MWAVVAAAPWTAPLHLRQVVEIEGGRSGSSSSTATSALARIDKEDQGRRADVKETLQTELADER